MVILKYKKSGKVLKLWHVNANSVDVIRLNILSWGLLDPIGTSRVKLCKVGAICICRSLPGLVVLRDII